MSAITTQTLRCGATLIVEPMTGVRSAAAACVLPAGSASDPEHLQGLSAMWSELLLRGAGSRSSREQADAFDRLGAGRGADVGALTFRISATMLGERLMDVLPLLVEMIRVPRMDEEAVEPCRDLALQALESLRDDPQERAMILLRQRHQPTPLNRSGMGTEEGLRAVTRHDLVQGWRDRALPGTSIFALAGDVNAAQISRALDSLLGDWSGSAPEPVIGPVPERGYGHESDQTSQVQIMLAHDAPPESSDESILEKLTIAVLSGGMAGRLFTEVREKRGLCYAVSAGYRGDRDYGITSAYVGTTPERAQESLDVLWAELQRVRTPGGRITPEEFQRAKVGMKSGLIFSGESTSARAGALAADFHRLGRARSLGEVAAQIDRVTLDELNAYLARRSLGRVTVQTLGPAPLTPPA